MEVEPSRGRAPRDSLWQYTQSSAPAIKFSCNRAQNTPGPKSPWARRNKINLLCYHAETGSAEFKHHVECELLEHKVEANFRSPGPCCFAHTTRSPSRRNQDQRKGSSLYNHGPRYASLPLRGTGLLHRQAPALSRPDPMRPGRLRHGSKPTTGRPAAPIQGSRLEPRAVRSRVPCAMPRPRNATPRQACHLCAAPQRSQGTEGRRSHKGCSAPPDGVRLART